MAALNQKELGKPKVASVQKTSHIFLFSHSLESWKHKSSRMCLQTYNWYDVLNTIHKIWNVVVVWLLSDALLLFAHVFLKDLLPQISWGWCSRFQGSHPCLSHESLLLCSEQNMLKNATMYKFPFQEQCFQVIIMLYLEKYKSIMFYCNTKDFSHQKLCNLSKNNWFWPKSKESTMCIRIMKFQSALQRSYLY